MTSGFETETISFKGYTWNVKTGVGEPGPNYWDASSDAVFVDSQGLHLTVALREGRWYSSEAWEPITVVFEMVQNGKVVEKGFFSSLAKKLKGYFG